MFGSKFRYFAKAFANLKTVANSKLFTLRNATVIASAMLILPTYVYATQNKIQQNSPTQQQPTLTDKQSHSQQNAAQNDQIVNFIADYDDVKKLGLQGHILIWYESTGNKVIDDEVIGMLRKYAQEKKNTMSCPFKVIIDTTPRSRMLNDRVDYYKKQIQLVIVKPDDLKAIPLTKYLSFNGIKDLKYSALFHRITTQINQFNEINRQNVHQFMASLGNKSYQASVVLCAPKDAVKFRKARKKFHAFIQSKQAFIANASKSIITDEQTIKQLGLPGLYPDSDNIYIIVPDSENIVKPGKTVMINNNKYHIYAPWNVSQSVVFSPYLQKSSPESFTLKVTVDLNQNVATQLSQLYHTLSQSSKYAHLSGLPKFLVFGPAQKNAKAIQISLEKNNFNQLVNVYSPGCRFSKQQKDQLLYGGHKWKFDYDQIQIESLQQWVGKVVNHKLQPTFQTEYTPETKVKVYNSTRITGEQYKSVLDKNKSKPKIVFYFSEHCASCNKFKHTYEQIAGEKKDQYDFYRIDNDYNKTQGLRNYNSTPIFLFYKNGTIYNFKNTIFSKQIFLNFLQVTSCIKKMDSSILDKAIKERAENQVKLTDFI